MLKQPKLDFYEEAGGKVYYQLEQDFIYAWEYAGVTLRLIIPKGFITDLASVPRFAWMLIRPDGQHNAAALVHDFLYMFRGKIPPKQFQVHEDGLWQNLDVVWTRKQCDRMFARLMREAGVNKLRRRTMFLSVRLFGRFYW